MDRIIDYCLGPDSIIAGYRPQFLSFFEGGWGLGTLARGPMIKIKYLFFFPPILLTISNNYK